MSNENAANRAGRGRRILAALSMLAALCLGGCASQRDTQPTRTANEELLISTATDHAAEQLKLQIPPGTKVFVDASNFGGTDSREVFDGRYAIGTLRDRLLKNGVKLVADRGGAEMVVEARSGSLSINQHALLVGLPAVPIPIPLAGTVTTPEIALFKRSEEQGIAKFATTAYDAKDGTLKDSSGAAYGFSHQTEWVVLLFISWTRSDLIPEDAKPKE
jgi:hypothetical protein